jgi:hypothetical protein
MGGQENKLRVGYDYFLSLRLYSKNNPHPSHPAWMRVTFFTIQKTQVNKIAKKL